MGPVLVCPACASTNVRPSRRKRDGWRRPLRCRDCRLVFEQTRLEDLGFGIEVTQRDPSGPGMTQQDLARLNEGTGFTTPTLRRANG